MKRLLQPSVLPFFVVGAGIVGMLLRIWLLLGGTDDGGLFIPGHIAGIALWVLTAIVLPILFIFTLRLQKAPKYSYNYPPSVIGGIGVAIAALGILLTSVMELMAGGDMLATISALFGLLCTTLLAVIALARWKGYRFSVLLHGIVCVYMMLHLICKYRQWSAEPQLLTYCFQLFCCASLTLAVFFRLCFDADNGKRRALVLTHLSAIFFGLIAIAGSKDWFFYLGTSLWMLTDLCNLQPAKSQKE